MRPVCTLPARLAWGLVATAAWCLLARGPAAAQIPLDRERDLSFDAPESWAMKYFASVSLFTGLGAPKDVEPGSVSIGLEGGHVPQLSESERRVGFDGTKVEDLNKTEVFGRPRVLVGLPAGWSLEASWLPPVEMFGVEPELYGLSVGRPVWRGAAARVGLRLALQYATFEGDLTCSSDELGGPNPFQCEAPSRDLLTARSGSLEASAAWPLGAEGRLEPFLTVIGSHLNLDFQVDALYAGIHDTTRLHTDGETLAAAAGLAYRAAEEWQLVAELFWTPLDVVRPPSTEARDEDLVNARAAVRYTVR